MARKESSAELSELVEKVDEWRRRRERRTRIPEELWDEAVRVAGRAGLWATAKATRIHYPDLKDRMVKAGLSRGPDRRQASGGGQSQSGHSRPNGMGLAGRAAFVELPRAAMSAGTRTVVEFEGQGGDRMRIEVSGGVDLAGLARAFLARDAR